MPKRTRVPRASLAVTILDDPDYITLMQTPEGRDAFAAFCALLCAARSQENGGVFRESPAVVAMLIRWPLEDFTRAMTTLRESTDWLGDTWLVIRNFKKWHSWGGSRPNTGPKKGSSGVQDAPKIDSKGGLPVSVTVSKKATALSDKSDGGQTPKPDKKEFTYPPGFEQFWGWYLRKVQKGAAHKAWLKLSKPEKLLAIDRAQWMAGCWKHNDPHLERLAYMPHPATWLNARGWEDDDGAVELAARGK